MTSAATTPIPTSGAFFAPSAGAVGFTDVFQGSLIGANNQNFLVEAIVPTEPEELNQGFGADETTFDAVESDSQGFFELSLGAGDIEFDPITETALDALADGGFPALTMRGVARTLGVSLATLQHHFPTKDALWRAAVISRSCKILPCWRQGPHQSA